MGEAIKPSGNTPNAAANNGTKSMQHTVSIALPALRKTVLYMLSCKSEFTSSR